MRRKTLFQLSAIRDRRITNFSWTFSDKSSRFVMALCILRLTVYSAGIIPLTIKSVQTQQRYNVRINTAFRFVVGQDNLRSLNGPCAEYITHTLTAFQTITERRSSWLIRKKLHRTPPATFVYDPRNATFQGKRVDPRGRHRRRTAPPLTLCSWCDYCSFLARTENKQ